MSDDTAVTTEDWCAGCQAERPCLCDHEADRADRAYALLKDEGDLDDYRRKLGLR